MAANLNFENEISQAYFNNQKNLSVKRVYDVVYIVV